MNETFKYSSFKSRLFATIIDGILISIPSFIIFATTRHSTALTYYIFTYTFSFLSWMFFVFTLVKFGGTPGKLLLGLRVVKLDGQRIDIKIAILRSIVELGQTVIFALLSIYFIIKIGYPNFIENDIFQIRNQIHAITPFWVKPFNYLFNAYMFSESIVMLTNKRRRAIHDYIAGTIVIHREINKSKMRFKLYESISNKN